MLIAHAVTLSNMALTNFLVCFRTSSGLLDALAPNYHCILLVVLASVQPGVLHCIYFPSSALRDPI